jgi:hypothetical protein
MQPPWQQNQWPLERWIRQELLNMLHSLRPGNGPANHFLAAFQLHALFFETARLHTETWSIRRDFYLNACLQLLSLWREFDQRGLGWHLQTSGSVSIQSLPVDASGYLLVEDPLKVGLWAMVSLFGMAQVEVAEILGWTESSVQRCLSEFHPTRSS